MVSRVERLARERAHEQRSAIALGRTFVRSMRIGTGTMILNITSMSASGEPHFETSWMYPRPERFTSAEMVLIDAFRVRAMAELRAELKATRP